MRRRDLILAVLVLLVAWQLLAWLLHVEVLPGPGTVIQAFVREVPNGLARHFLVSTWRVVASIVLAMLLAVPAGLVLGQSRAMDRFFAPIIYIVYPIPKIVFLPVILLLLGIGDRSKIFISFVVLFFQILVVVRDQAERAAARVDLLGAVAGRWAAGAFSICLSAGDGTGRARPRSRVSVGTAIAVLFFAESFATTSGLGYYIINDSWGRLGLS